jgi:CheY-like chemotaxis protein
MQLVLAIEPDLRQATILKRIVRDKVHADVAVVDSPDAAITAIGTRVPDVVLLSALLSPRDEDELIAHLRSLNGVDHIQTHTIPQLASTAADQEQGGRKGLLGVFKRKKDAPQPIVAGCDPDMFAEEISAFLQRAAEKKAESVAVLQSRVDQLEYLVQSNALPETQAAAAAAHLSDFTEPGAQTAREPEPEPQAGESESSWSSPFEWKKKTAEPQRREPESQVTSPESQVLSPESQVTGPESQVSGPEFQVSGPASDVEPASYDATHEPYVATPEPYAADREPVSEILSARGATETVPTRFDTDVTLIDTPGSSPYADIHVAAEAPHVELHDAGEPIFEPVGAGSNGNAHRDAAPEHPKRRNKVAAATLLRLTPLAMWARTEATAVTPPRVEPPEPQTAAEELRHLMAHLGVPPHVAGVSYGRGCRIRRVRVPGGKERRRADAPGPVILSKRALDRQREANQ